MKTALACLLLSMTLAASGQQEILFVPGDSRCCSTIFLDGVSYQSISDGAITVVASKPSLFDKNTFQQSFSISSNDANPILVDPQLISISMLNRSGGRIFGMDADTFTAAKEKRARRGVMFAAMANGFAAGVSQQQATVNYSDGSSSTINYHDPNADRIARENTTAVMERVEARISSMSSGALRKNSLFQGRTISGVVYFSKPKDLKIKQAFVDETTVRIGERRFVFP